MGEFPESSYVGQLEARLAECEKEQERFKHEANKRADEAEAQERIERHRTVAAEHDIENQVASAEAALGRCEQEKARYREALEGLMHSLDYEVDLSDDHTLDHAAPGEMVACTRSVEAWRTLREARVAARGVLSEGKG